MRLLAPETLLVLIVTLLTAFETHAIPPDQARFERTPERSVDLSVRWLPSIIGEIADAYYVPISTEWSYVNEDQSPIKSPRFAFEVRKGDTLSVTLDQLVEATQGAVRWELIEGIICVYPSGRTGTVSSLLDVTVSMELHNVSTWEAFLELCRIINASDPAGRQIKPVALPIDEGLTPPPGMREEKTVSIDLRNVPARTAACAILAASPFHMQFTYHWNQARPNRPPTAEISLLAYDKYHRLVHGPRMITGREWDIWFDEARSVLSTPETKTSPKP